MGAPAATKHERPRLLLINAIQSLDGRPQRGWNGHLYVPPLGLGYVAAVTRESWDIRIVDENAGDDGARALGWRPSLVGISAHTATVPPGLRACGALP